MHFRAMGTRTQQKPPHLYEVEPTGQHGRIRPRAKRHTGGAHRRGGATACFTKDGTGVCNMHSNVSITLIAVIDNFLKCE